LDVIIPDDGTKPLTSLHLFLLQQAQYGLEHHMANHLLHSMKWLLMLFSLKLL
jgi:hypothetical protein